MNRTRAAAVAALLLVTCLPACKQPFQVCATGRVTTEIPAVQAFSRVCPVKLGAGNGGTRVAVVDVDGVLLNLDMVGMGSLGENPVALFRERLDAVAGDPCVRAVVVRINSPGGGLAACDMMRHELVAFQSRTGLPVVTCLLDVAAGGAYYLASASDQIVAHPTTVTGGLGVILNLYSLEDMMSLTTKVTEATVKAGDRVDLGSPLHKLDDENRALLQAMADEYHLRITTEIQQARSLRGNAAHEIFDGRVFTASIALEHGLVDSLGYLDEAIEIARELGHCPGARVVMYHRTNDQPRTPYDITPNVPLQSAILPLSIPGLERSRLPTFLCMWQPDPTLERWGGH